MAKFSLILPFAIVAVSSTVSAQFFRGGAIQTGPAWNSLSTGFVGGFPSPSSSYGLSSSILSQPVGGSMTGFGQQLSSINNDRFGLSAFGGNTNLPGGGFNQLAGVKSGPVWGSLSQDFDKRKVSTPITVGVGAGHTSPNGNGLSGQILHQPGNGGLGSINGQVGLVNTDTHKLTAFGQHERFLDKNVKPIGPAINTAGVKYENAGGANVMLTGNQVQGLPATGSIGANLPLHKDKDTTVTLGGQTNFGQGMKPNSQVGLTIEQKI